MSDLCRELSGRIIALINSRKLKPGDSLGTETELVKELGSASRSVREAVVGLRALGLLESRRKAGITVAAPCPAHILTAGIEVMGRTAEGFRHLKELRFTLELGSLRLAALKMTPALARGLYSLCDQFEALAAEGREFGEIVELDKQFHQSLLRATENPMIFEQHIVVSEYFKRHIEAHGPEEPSKIIFERAVWEHRELISALEDGNAEYAGIIMSRHIERIFKKR